MNAPVTMPTMASEADVGAHLPNKYLYPEFAGWAGERYVKKLLRQILPMALYRTWEILAEQQANGNACYVGVSRLAAIAGRTVRTVQKNLAELEARQLLVERAERNAFREPDGRTISRAVVVKDFSNLYALAHEYHEWLNGADYIAPVREFRPLIAQAPHLIAKLRRFDNYRRVLSHQLPGPTPKVREEDRWFTEYQAEEIPSACAVGRAPGASEPPLARGANKQEPQGLAKQLTKDSPKRITVPCEKNPPKGDSCDSGSRFLPSSRFQEEGSPAREREQTERACEAQSTAVAEAGSHVLPSSPSAPSTQRSGQRQRQNETEAKREGQLVTGGQGELPPGHRASEQRSAPPDHPLVRSFVQEIAAPFGDVNPRGSLTRVLSILAEARLSHPTEVLPCLVRAYTVARDTRTIRAEHWNARTGRANRMPLFCAMVERFAEACAQERMGNASWHQIEEAIAADSRLTSWWNDQRHLIGNPSSAVFEERGGEQNRPGVCFPDHAPEPAQRVSHTPFRHPHSLGCNSHNNVSTTPSRGMNFSPTIMPLPPHQPNQYERYVNALMAHYSAPGAFQEVP